MPMDFATYKGMLPPPPKYPGPSSKQRRREFEYIQTVDYTTSATSPNPPPSQPGLPPGAASPVAQAWNAEPRRGIDDPRPPAITYSFSQVGNSTMLVVPPRYARDSQPAYHISWYEDYFMPGNVITLVRRGDSADGLLVGEFNLKGGLKGGMVSMGSTTKWLADVAKIATHNTKWHFDDSSPRLFWERSANTSTCTLGVLHGGGPVAKLTPPHYNVQYPSDRVSKLEVQPSGQDPDIFDHIVISALIIERLRSTGNDSERFGSQMRHAVQKPGRVWVNLI